MLFGGIIAAVIIVLSILIFVGVLPLSNQVVGGMFFGLALGICGPVYEVYRRNVPV